MSTDNFKGGNSSNLYLVTFLATLFLLLFISCAIVLRSYVLRRRFQRQLDEAVAAGFMVSPRAQGSRGRRFGPKPKLYNTSITHGGNTWSDMMPISALPFQAKRRNKIDTPLKHLTQQQGIPPSHLPSPVIEQPTSFHERFLRPVRKPNTNSTPAAEEKPTRTKIDMLQVAVLISMPSLNRPANCSTSTFDKADEDEEDIPDIAFGVCRLPYKSPGQPL